MAVDLHIGLGDRAVGRRFTDFQSALVLSHLKAEGVGVMHPGFATAATQDFHYDMVFGQSSGDGQLQSVLAGRQWNDRGERRLEDARLVSIPVGEGVSAEEEFGVHAVIIDRDRGQPFPGEGNAAVLHLEVKGRLALGRRRRGLCIGGRGAGCSGSRFGSDRLAFGFVEVAGKIGKQSAPARHRIGFVTPGDLAGLRELLFVQIGPGQEVVVLDSSADLVGSYPCQTGQPFAHPILKEQVASHRQLVVGHQSGLEGQHPQEAQVLFPKHGIGDPPPGSDRVCPGIDEGEYSRCS